MDTQTPSARPSSAPVPAPVPSGRGTARKKRVRIAIVAIIAAATAYLGYAYFAGIVPFGPDASSPQGPDTAGWKTYASERYGFEVKYPSSGTVIGTLETADTITIVPEGGTGATSQNSIRFSIRPFGQTAGTASGSWQPTTFAGRPAYRTASTTPAGDPVVMFLVEVGQSKELVITVPGVPSPSLFDDVIATFRFTTTLFSDPAYRFTFSYPADWDLRQDDVAGALEVRNRKGTSVTVRQVPAPSLQDLVRTATVADETYVASAYPGILVRKAGQAQVAEQEKYLAWNDGTGVVITLSGSKTVADREGLLSILSTLVFPSGN